MKTIICEEYQKEILLHALAEKAEGTLTDLQVKSLANLFEEESEDMPARLLYIAAILKNNEEEYPIYRDMFSFPAFLQEILSFAKECILYGIAPSSLPSANMQEAELRKIIQAVVKTDLPEKRTIAKSEEKIQEILTQKDVSLYPFFEKNPFYYRIRERLRQHLPEEAVGMHEPQKHLRFALNMRQEIEAVAQDICMKKASSMIVLCNPSSYLPVLEEVFHRYHIPYSVTDRAVYIHIHTVFEALGNLSMRKDIPSFIDALKKDAFPHVCNDELIRFFEDVLVDFDKPIDICSHLENTVFQSNARFLQPLEKEAEIYFNHIYDDLTYLLESEDAKDALIRAFKIMQKSPFLQKQEELSAAMQIRTSLSESLEMIQGEEEARFFLDTVLTMTSSASAYITDFCMVTDLSHPLPAKENAYILGCSGTSYPGFQANKGLFDESYLSRVGLYPSMEERYDIYTSQLEWLNTCAAKNLYYSYANNDYQGREIQLSFVIETMFDKKSIQKWNLKTMAPLKDPVHSILPETAQELFKGDGYIHGSISTIERYFQCAYSYFLQSGLKLRKKEIGGLDARTTGDIAHSVLEHAILKYGKDYASIPEEKLREIIHASFEVLDIMHPHMKILHQMSEERLFRQLKMSLLFLADFEKSTAFIPEAVEKKFEEEIVQGVKLRGTIDRVNLFADMVEIIDYKSSIHTLSQEKVLAGIQLQLLTYAIIANRLYHKDVAGVYYFSFKQEPVPVQAMKKVRKEIEETSWDEEAEFERMIHSRMMKGWTFMDRPTEIDDGSRHMSLRSTYIFEDVQEIISALYTYFQDSLLQGYIPLNPLEDACGFCELKSICRFHGLYRKAEHVTDLTLEKGGKDEI